MKKSIYTTVFIITVLLISFGQTQAQSDTYVSRDKGIMEFLYTGNPVEFVYSSDKNPKAVKLKIVSGDMMSNTYKVSFPNDTKVYVLKMQDNKIYCTNPDGTKQTFIKIGNGTSWEGTINGNLKIQMYLEFVGMQPDNKIQNFEGWYYYESQGSSNKIKLKGTAYMNTFNLEEITNGRKTGDFSFSPSGGYFQGTWKSTNGKTFPVKLKMK